MQIKLDMSITGSAKSWKGYEKQAAAGGGTVHPSAREDTGVSDQVKPNPIQIIWRGRFGSLKSAQKSAQKSIYSKKHSKK